MADGLATPQANAPVLEKFPPLLANRNFLLLWLGAVISALGDRIHFIVMLGLVTKLLAHKYGNPHYEVGTLESSQLTVMMLLPFLLFGPVTGLLADRFPRRAIMIISDLARVGLVIAARFLFLRGTSILDDNALYAILLATEFVLACFAATFSPARLALIPQLVHPTQLLRANSMTSAAGTIASLIGFVLGGALWVWSQNIAMFADAGTFLGSAVCLFLMRVPARLRTPASEATSKPGAIAEFKEGIAYIRVHRRVLQITLLLLLFWSCGGIILNGLTGIVTQQFGLSLTAYSYFMGVIGAGMVVGAASVSLFKRGFPKEIGVAWAMVGVGVFLICFSLVRHWQTALVFVTLAAACGAVLLVSLETLLQRIVPNFVRGRVMGTKDVITTAGLVGFTIPLALLPNIDHGIHIILLVLAIIVGAVGLWLVIYYYRRLPFAFQTIVLLRFARGFLTFWHRYARVGACTIPAQGPVVVVANHTGAMDPVILQISSRRRIIHFMMAKEYYEKKPWYWLYKAFGTIPVNRSGTDIAAVRSALRALKDEKVIGLFPEGRISLTGEIQDARNGVAAIVLMAKATLVPAYISGTLPHAGMVKDFTVRARLRVRYGTPMRFDEFAGKERDKEVLDEVTRRIMAGITKLRDKARTIEIEKSPVESTASTALSL